MQKKNQPKSKCQRRKRFALNSQWFELQKIDLYDFAFNLWSNCQINTVSLMICEETIIDSRFINNSIHRRALKSKESPQHKPHEAFSKIVLARPPVLITDRVKVDYFFYQRMLQFNSPSFFPQTVQNDDNFDFFPGTIGLRGWRTWPGRGWWHLRPTLLIKSHNKMIKKSPENILVVMITIS